MKIPLATIAAQVLKTKRPVVEQRLRPLANDAAASAERRVAKRGMNKWETDYAARLELLRRSGEVTWCEFEPISIRLATGANFKPDFLVVYRDGTTAVEEVKGWERAASIVRFKVAAERMPCWTFRMWKLDKGVWTVTRELNPK